MKRIIWTCILFGLIFGMCSCEMETTDNGDLDGFWHLESVDTLSTGGTCSYKERKVFWGVQHKLIAIRNFAPNAASNGYYVRFNQTGDSLIISSPYANHWHQDYGDDGGDVPVTEINAELRELGMNNLEEHFKKEKLSGSKMVLTNKEYRLSFTKF